jgi:hypothetical protein
MNSRKKASLKLSSLTPEAKKIKAQSIKDSMQASVNFTNPPLPYVDVQTLIDDFGASITQANSNGATAEDTRNMHEQEKLLVSAFNMLKMHVEFVANNSLDPEAVILSAGMQVAINGGANAVAELTLDAGGGGTVVIRVPRGPEEKAFVFEISNDGVSYSRLRSSTLTKVTISGYTAGSTIYIRYFAITKNGDGVVSAAKSVMVV